MRRHLVLFCALPCVVAGVAWARNIAWRPAEKPRVSLQRALVLAEAELKKERGAYHCIGATLAKTFSAGDWQLHYASRDGKVMWVSVGSDERVRTSKQGFEY